MDGLAHDVRRLGEDHFDLVGRRAGDRSRHVSRVLVVDPLLDVAGRGVVDDGAQRVVVDGHDLGCVLGDVPVGADHERHGVADELRLPIREWRPRRIGNVPAHGGVPLLAHIRVQVGGREHGADARHGERP